MKRILMFIFILLGLVSFVNAVSTANNVGYWTFDGILTDSTGNGNTLTNSGATSTGSGKINGAYTYITNDYMEMRNTFSSTWLNTFDTQDKTMCAWIKTSESVSIVTAVRDSDNAPQIELISVISGELRVIIQDNGGTGVVFSTTGTNVDDNAWHFACTTWDFSTDTATIYMDGAFETSSTGSVGSISAYSSAEYFTIGARNTGGSKDVFFNGAVDEVSIWDRKLSLTDIQDLYNLGSGIQYPFIDITPVPIITLDNVTANNVTLVDNTFYNDTIQFQTFVTNTSTNDNVNHSYSLNGGAFTQYATNDLNGSVNLNLSEGYYNISFYAFNNETNVTSNNYSYIVDLTAPTIDKIGNISQSSYSVDFSEIYNVTDALSGLDTCTLEIVELSNVSNPDNYNISCTATQTFTSAGFHNITVSATDNAGNVATLQENFTINPFINVFFNTSNGTVVKDYNIIVYHPDGRNETPTIQSDGSIQLSPVNNGSLDLGNHTLAFSKAGFATENFTQLVNETNANTNVSFTVTESKIIITIYDRETEQVLTGLTQISILATNGFYGNTTTGYLNVSGLQFIPELYQILATHEGYNPESIYFNYNAQELLNVDIYMLNTTQVGQIKLIVKNSLSQFVEGAICNVLEWRPLQSSFVSIAEGLTNVDGEAIMNIELNTKIYKFSCTKQDFTTTTNSQVIQVDNSQLTIILDDIVDVPDTLFPNLITSMTNTTLNSTHQLITYNFADGDGLTTEGCIKHYFINGNRRVFAGEQCVATSTGQILLTLNVNSTEGILVQGVLTTPSVTDYVTDQIQFKGVGSIADQFKIIGLDVLIPTILVLIGLALGIAMSKIEIAAVLVAVAGWVSVAFVPTIMKSSIAMFISVVVGLMLWGGYKGR